MKQNLKIIFTIISLLATLSLLCINIQFGGLRLFTVTTASMEPTLATGSLIIVRYIHPSKLRVGDVITFRQPNNPRHYITHRIQKITQNEALKIFETKGDRNDSTDVWQLAEGGIVGKLTVNIPKVGYLVTFLRTKVGVFLGIIVPSLYIIFEEVRSIVSLNKNKRIIPYLLLCFMLTSFAISHVSLTKSLLLDQAQLLSVRVQRKTK